MAVIAGLPDFGEILAAMTAIATHHRMCACERKASAAVIESRFCPCCLVVAGTAVIAKRACVDVIHAMAAGTLGRRLAVQLAIGVAAITACGGVGSLQDEVR